MYRVTITVPDYDSHGVPQLDEQLALERAILESCGGFSSVQVRGGWVDDDGETVIDTSTRYEIDTLEPERIEPLAAHVCERWDQAAVYVTRHEIHADLATARTTVGA
jgi:hypothetical protein